jgi:FAD:protein FMN transferase
MREILLIRGRDCVVGRLLKFVVAGCWAIAWTAVAAPAAETSSLKRYEFSEVHMGTDFRIVLYAGDEKLANRAAAAAYARVKELNGILSDYDPQSELSRLSATAGSGQVVKLGDDLWRVLERSQQLAADTGGAFDVTVGPLTKMWRSARRSKTFPADERLREARAATGFRNLQMDASARSARLSVPQMRLDLGGIGMGYAADEALAVLKRHGITSAMIDASGDVVCGAAPPGERGWKIALVPLRENDETPSRFVWLSEASLTTSGDAFQFVELNGVRYSHIVDPSTGLGLTTRSSVTVTARDGMTADSLATAVCVLGPERGLKLIAATPGAAALILRVENGESRIYASPNFLDDAATKRTPSSPPNDGRKH